MEKISKNKYFTILKWIWILAVFAAVFIYYQKNFSEIDLYLISVPWYRFLLSMIFIGAAKSVLARISLITVENEGWNPGYQKIFTYFNITQLGKYLPGGFWHYVGRFSIYHSDQFAVKKTVKAIITENVWLISSAILMGLSFMLLFSGDKLQEYGINLSKTLSYMIVLGIIISWIGAMFLYQRLFIDTEFWNTKGVLFTIILLSITWILFGMSFLLLFSEFTWQLLGLAIGGYSLSWSIGYLAIFAPGGLGIRELAISFFFSTTKYASLIIIVATIHRLLYIVVELLLAFISLLVKKK